MFWFFGRGGKSWYAWNLQKWQIFFRIPGNLFLPCKQGIMGSFYVKEAEQIRAALAVLGDFTFFDGEPDRGLVTFLPKERQS